jgi:phage antirepressor YoqD-like protein
LSALFKRAFSINTSGAKTYATDSFLTRTLSDPEYAIRVFMQMRAEKNARLAAEQKLSEQQPLVNFADACSKSPDTILIRELAKVACKHGIEIGEKRLYQKLREWGYILKNNTEPYQSALNAGYFEVEQATVEINNRTVLKRTTRVTPKGQILIISKLKQCYASYLTASTGQAI